jgi:Zn-finger nucleic acid-binding protein
MTSTSDPTIDCPKCGTTMRQLRVDEIVIDRCETCYGIWLDGGERLKITSSPKLADVVDIGQARTGRAQDRLTQIDCPRCRQRMQHKKHPDQQHVGFEECQECGGSFFDAGELRDLSRLTLSDLLKHLLGRR